MVPKSNKVKASEDADIFWAMACGNAEKTVQSTNSTVI